MKGIEINGDKSFESLNVQAAGTQFSMPFLKMKSMLIPQYFIIDITEYKSDSKFLIF
ncbi:hypothetical protein HMP0721_2163 [Pseudoramibacter alactolyticus ATCC 23263]|uniref:Uncharacterized protein n=1 Tax=Pseudoramibacter alactolyticus ATCC 23263 TaxID=887929 RepID=E6MJH8_9FIRM|nr:hypothetical protein HMP0721_2163 [Pseudoramibacter alactolyticus ATCC 23263]